MEYTITLTIDETDAVIAALETVILNMPKRYTGPESGRELAIQWVVADWIAVVAKLKAVQMEGAQ